eukprot:1926667-Pleurochrysis_carterae.AAC.1
MTLWSRYSSTFTIEGVLSRSACPRRCRTNAVLGDSLALATAPHQSARVIRVMTAACETETLCPRTRTEARHSRASSEP